MRSLVFQKEAIDKSRKSKLLKGMADYPFTCFCRIPAPPSDHTKEGRFGMANDKLLTPDEAGKRLSCSRSHIVRLIVSGKLRGVNIGNSPRNARWRVSEEALAEFIQAASTPEVTRFRTPTFQD